MRKLFSFLSLLVASTSTLAQPTLEPGSGLISQINQEFVYQSNGTAVDRFTLWIGTGPTGASARDIFDSGDLGGNDGSYIAPFLPTGTVYVRLRYRVGSSWGKVDKTYAVSNDDPVGVALLNELGCDVGEIIRVTSDGWECLDSDSLAGPDYADELCALYRHSGATPPGALLCPDDNDRYVFVTRNLVNGNMGGVRNADAVCQSEADSASLPGVYRAFLSSEHDSVRSRLRLRNGVTYQTPANTVVATSLDQFYDWNVDLNNPINRHANGAIASGELGVWSGAYGDDARDCAAWTALKFPGSTSDLAGRYGRLDRTDDRWLVADVTSSLLRACNRSLRLYCVEM